MISLYLTRRCFSVPAVLLLAALALLTACGEKKPARARIPAPPPILATPPSQPQPPPAETSSTPPEFPPDAKPIYVETGYASWYGAPYHNRKAANGETYDMNQLTAAHRTLPLNSMVRVTNLKTSHSAVVRITDRGPFVTDRIIDLSMAAAKAVDVWRPGTARVRLDVLSAPRDLTGGGRWCVQIGAIKEKEMAANLKTELVDRYPDAQVLQFVSPVGDWWVRIRVPKDDKKLAEEVARTTRPEQGSVFLVRID